MENNKAVKIGLYEKLANIQNELKAPKGQYNKFGNYYYRSCEDILEALKPICFKYRTALIVQDELESMNERYYIKAVCELRDWDSDDVIITHAFAREPNITLAYLFFFRFAIIQKFQGFFELFYKFSFVTSFNLFHVFFCPFVYIFCLIEFFFTHFKFSFDIFLSVIQLIIKVTIERADVVIPKNVSLFEVAKVVEDNKSNNNEMLFFCLLFIMFTPF